MAAELFHADRQTDRHDEANSRFLQYCERVQKNMCHIGGRVCRKEVRHIDQPPIEFLTFFSYAFFYHLLATCLIA